MLGNRDGNYFLHMVKLVGLRRLHLIEQATRVNLVAPRNIIDERRLVSKEVVHWPLVGDMSKNGGACKQAACRHD